MRDAQGNAALECMCGNERILLVEDEPAVRRMAARCLRRLGYHVTEAASGVDALQMWEREGGAFDLLFTDMVMPGDLSGMELCSRLRQARAGLRALIASGYSTELASDEPGAALGVGFLSKPYDVSALAAAVRECLDDHHAR